MSLFCRMSSENQTIPHHETVARVAYFNDSTSNSNFRLGGILSHSPFGKVSSLLSSKTELRFSAQTGSTSPSKTIQCILESSPQLLSSIHLRIEVKTPSVHSNVVLSRLPYNCSLDRVFGSIM